MGRVYCVAQWVEIITCDLYKSRLWVRVPLSLMLCVPGQGTLPQLPLSHPGDGELYLSPYYNLLNRIVAREKAACLSDAT